MLQTDSKEAVKGIYKIQNSVCARDSFVCARDRCIVCKEHIHDNYIIDLITSYYLVNMNLCAKDRPDRGCREHIFTKLGS